MPLPHRLWLECFHHRQDWERNGFLWKGKKVFSAQNKKQPPPPLSQIQIHLWNPNPAHEISMKIGSPNITCFFYTHSCIWRACIDICHQYLQQSFSKCLLLLISNMWRVHCWNWHWTLCWVDELNRQQHILSELAPMSRFRLHRGSWYRYLLFLRQAQGSTG